MVWLSWGVLFTAFGSQVGDLQQVVSVMRVCFLEEWCLDRRESAAGQHMEIQKYFKAYFEALGSVRADRRRVIALSMVLVCLQKAKRTKGAPWDGSL